MTETVKLYVYDSYSNQYTVDQTRAIHELMIMARGMGYRVRSDDHNGWYFNWIEFDDAADAAFFKLRYL